MNIHESKGFFNIKLILAIVVGVLALSGISVYFLGQYKASKSERAVNTELQNFLNSLRNKGTTSGPTTPRSELFKSNAEIIDAIKPSTVYIVAPEDVGSGIIIEEEGYILTSAHVVKGAESVIVRLSNGIQLTARVVGRDEEVDIALLKTDVDNPQIDLLKAPLGNSDLVSQGDRVFVLGYPFGLETDVSFKEGTISRKLQEGNRQFLETTADILPGDSGGPLVNEAGEVIGINSARFGEQVGGVSVGETLKFATPINIAKDLLVQLKRGREVIVAIAEKKEEKTVPLAQAQREYEAFLEISKEVNKKINEAIAHHEIGYRHILAETYTSSANQFQDATDIFFEAITLNAKKIIPRVPFANLFEENKKLVEDEIKKRIEASQVMRDYAALLKINPDTNFTEQIALLDKDQLLTSEADVILENIKQINTTTTHEAELYFGQEF
ncbi:MAG: trypsin-like peptidase domain-containing protein [Candidatus Paceibacterota bacterium]